MRSPRGLRWKVRLGSVSFRADDEIATNFQHFTYPSLTFHLVTCSLRMTLGTVCGGSVASIEERFLNCFADRKDHFTCILK